MCNTAVELLPTPVERAMKIVNDIGSGETVGGPKVSSAWGLIKGWAGLSINYLEESQLTLTSFSLIRSK